MTGIASRLKTRDEKGRQCALERLDVLDTPAENGFEKITGLVRTIFDVPVAAVSLIDKDRQWFKSIQGLDISETAREVAFCDHTIRKTDCMCVPDATKDPRFAKNILVTGPPHIRSYLGAPIISPDGYALGALCAIDYRPRQFSPEKEKVLASFADLVMNELELRQLASCDGLTGLATRRAFVDAAEEVFEQGRNAAFIFIDLDHFKAINDANGHPVGDDVLKATSAALLANCPDHAFIGRLGGEELAVLLPDTDRQGAFRLAESLRAAIAATTVKSARNLAFTASVGVAMQDAAHDLAGWMAAADAALYEAKSRGRNCTVIGYSDQLSNAV